MLELHNDFLVTKYGTDISKYKFETAVNTKPGNTDTVISKSNLMKVGIITRHLLDMTCNITHVLILKDNCYNRIDE